MKQQLKLIYMKTLVLSEAKWKCNRWGIVSHFVAKKTIDENGVKFYIERNGVNLGNVLIYVDEFYEVGECAENGATYGHSMRASKDFSGISEMNDDLRNQKISKDFNSRVKRWEKIYLSIPSIILEGGNFEKVSE